MTLQEIVRQQTQEPLDALSLLERKRVELLSGRAAGKNRLKQTASNIKGLRAREDERKRQVSDVDRKIAELHSKLEEIDRQRSELIDRLLETQGERTKAESSLGEARHDIEKAQSNIRAAREAEEAARKELEKLVEERNRHQGRLREGYLAALDRFLEVSAKRIENAFVSQEERQRTLAAAEAFRKARHEDPKIGDLCDQRDQFSELLKKATVPGVRLTLEGALREIEKTLDALYPGAVVLGEQTPEPSFIEELHYFVDSRDRVSIVLPVGEAVWNAIGEGRQVPAGERTVKLLWSFVTGSGLKPSDGQFIMESGRCIFATEFTPDVVSALAPFALPLPGSGILEFIFSPVPAPIQEVLNSEAED